MVNRLLQEIKTILGPNNKCLGRGWRLNFDEKELTKFLSSLSEDQAKLLAKCLTFFRIHLEPMGGLINKGAKKSFSLEEFMADRAWSSFSLSVIFSIIDHLTVRQHKKRKPFTEYLKEHLSEITKESAIDRLATEHQKLWPPSIHKNLLDFYDSYLTDEEKTKATEKYRAKERKYGKLKIGDFGDVIEDLYGKYRSGFVHSMEINFLWNEPHEFSMDDKTNVISIYTNLSPSEFLFISWEAIFRYFGFKGSINANFTDEEKEVMKKTTFASY